MRRPASSKFSPRSVFLRKKINPECETVEYVVEKNDPSKSGSLNNNSGVTATTEPVQDFLTYSNVTFHSPTSIGVMSFIPTALRHTNCITLCPGQGLTDDSSYESGSDLSLPSRISPTSLLKDVNNLAMRTSEQDPAAYQMEIPKAEEMLLNGRLCALLDMHDSFDENFEFKTMIGISNLALKKFASFGKKTTDVHNLKDQHRPIVQKLLESGDGITVQGYAKGQAEAVVFDVPSRSKIVVVFRGSNEQQAKPIKKVRQFVAPSTFCQDQTVTVHPSFKQTYFELESMFLPMVEKLTEENPFAQVVFCGHSFGAGLATMAGVRYASHRPTMRVTVHAFGSPKVGSIDFRHLANSLSNLRVFRLEMRRDSVTVSPQDSANKWIHVGHSISVGKEIVAHRFDLNKPIPDINILKQKKGSIETYLTTLVNCVEKKQWVASFSGENIGDGVRGAGNEKRDMA